MTKLITQHRLYPSDVIAFAGKRGGGAGIGTGLNCDVNEIAITKSNIIAKAPANGEEGGAGIGSGRAGSVGTIKITNCPSVEAVGGPHSAGIGWSSYTGNHNTHNQMRSNSFDCK